HGRGRRGCAAGSRRALRRRWRRRSRSRRRRGAWGNLSDAMGGSQSRSSSFLGLAIGPPVGEYLRGGSAIPAAGGAGGVVGGRPAALGAVGADGGGGDAGEGLDLAGGVEAAGLQLGGLAADVGGDEPVHGGRVEE